MILRKTFVAGLLACLPVSLHADFSYDQTSKITGGAMAGLMKFAGAFSKQLREPIKSTVVIQGNRMAHIDNLRTNIIDLDAETITDVNHQKKTYSVMTFDEMRQALEQMSQRMKDAKNQQDPQASDRADVDFKVSMKDTGQTRQINGLNTSERVLTVEMEGTDKQTGNKGSMVMTSDLWLAPKAPGYDEVRDFYQKMAKKLNWNPQNVGLSMGRADIGKGMSGLNSEVSKLDGIPILQVVTMTSAGQDAGQAGAQPQSQPASKPAETPSIGNVLGGRLGGFGGLGRRRKQETKEEPKQETKDDSSTQTSTSSTQGSNASASLLEMTIEMSSFSSDPVDASRFAVPGGYKKVDSEMLKAQHRAR